MKTLIAYASKYGCTESCARKLADGLGPNVDVHNLSSDPNVDLAPYQKVVVGSPIYVGKILPAVRSFVEDNHSELLQKTIGLFICGANKDQASEQLKQAFPAALLQHATATGCFGYEIHMSKLSFLERLAMRVIMKTRDDQLCIDEEAIKRFAEAFGD